MIPQNEQGTIALFARLSSDLGYTFKEIGTRCPDAILRKNGHEVRVEFEYESLSFKRHKHNPDDVDLVICWHDDWDACPVPVLCLETYVTLARSEEKLPRWQRWLEAFTDFRIRISDYFFSVKRHKAKNKASTFCPFCGEVMEWTCHYNSATPGYLESSGSYYRFGYAERKCSKCGYIRGEDIYDHY